MTSAATATIAIGLDSADCWLLWLDLDIKPDSVNYRLIVGKENNKKVIKSYINKQEII